MSLHLERDFIMFLVFKSFRELDNFLEFFQVLIMVVEESQRYNEAVSLDNFSDRGRDNSNLKYNTRKKNTHNIAKDHINLN